MISATASWTVAGAGANDRILAASATGSPFSVSRSDRIQSLQHQVHGARLELVRHRVCDQARRALGDLLAYYEAVLPQRAPGCRQVDDALDQPRQRRELDRALDLDDLGPATRVEEVPRGDAPVVGNDP